MDNYNNIISTIKLAITEKKQSVIESLHKSGIYVRPNISNEDLLYTIVNSIKNGNGKLMYYLGSLIDIYLPKGEEYSNIAPVVGAALIGAGTQLLGGLFGGGGGSSQAQAQAQAQAAAQAAAQAEAIKQMQIAQSLARAEQIRREREAQENKAKNNRTIITVSMIGGTLLIGTIITIIALKK